nr:P27 family phage terminase small subunit [uncultured Mediterraneibacter sp.]
MAPRKKKLTEKRIRESLVKQLERRGMSAEFYEDLINDYVHYWNLKKDLLADIEDKGLRYETINGNGVRVEKANESVVNLQKTTSIMLKILTDLKLKEPIAEPENLTDGYL